MDRGWNRSTRPGPAASPHDASRVTHDLTADGYGREAIVTLVALAITLLATGLTARHLADVLAGALRARSPEQPLQVVAFAAILTILIYGNVVYHLCRLGHLRRLARHTPARAEELHTLIGTGQAPRVAILVPSYREDAAVLRQTLLSAALQDYPNRRVVLLIDNPPDPKTREEQVELAASRQLPDEIAALLAEPAARVGSEAVDFERRARDATSDLAQEAARVQALTAYAAQWFQGQAGLWPTATHTDALFVEKTFREPARTLFRETRALAVAQPGPLAEGDIRRQYRRLRCLFEVKLSSFERKRYVNLSHAANKAANLNSYIGLLGKDLVEESRADGLHLVPADHREASLSVGPAEYVLTLDADTLLARDYTVRLVHLMEQPENARVGVAQTPYSAIPRAPGLLERIAGATTDIQYLIHQGFTYYGATFWVGANALIRMAALRDVATVEVERGFAVAKYVQDRTVIEDTESSLDLAARGWRLHNYPERLAYSATPPDFGALLIQRRRWANGGLLILPKALRYLLGSERRRTRLLEGFLRCHYLVSIAGVSIGLLLLLLVPFDEAYASPWLPLTAVPYYLLYAWDLVRTGYRVPDLFRVYALNLLLVPVNLGGVMKSMEQACTGRKIPFGRTPKIQGRTAVPARYVLAVYVLLAYCVGAGLRDALQGVLVHAFFSWANAALLAYSLGAFVGWHDSLADLARGVGVGSWPRPARRAVAVQEAPVV